MAVTQMQKQTTKLSDKQLAFVDKLTSDLGYKNRSETIRWIVCFARNVWLNMGSDYLQYMCHCTLKWMVLSRRENGKLQLDELKNIENTLNKLELSQR